MKIETSALPIKGFYMAGCHAGIKKDNSVLDMALIYAPNACAAAGVFTKNVTKAAPVSVSQTNLGMGTPKAILVNSGNANACTGTQGDQDAKESTEAIAKLLNINPQEVMVASTGIIGLPLPMTAMHNGIEILSKKVEDSAYCAEQGLNDAATAIMTTDTFAKSVTCSFEYDGKVGHITGIAKGSGMIHPNMATMLGFVMTDAQISSQALQTLLSDITVNSFNMISVDGDTSTNDMVLAMASGDKNAPAIINNDSTKAFEEALETVCKELAMMIAKDGEGATKLLQMTVEGAATPKDARLAAKAVIASSLVKAAFFGNDANWGRIICAMGYSGANFDPQAVDLHFKSENGEITLMQAGMPVPFDEELALKVLSTDKVNIIAKLQDGSASATAWGCDLTYDYVKINGEYRS